MKNYSVLSLENSQYDYVIIATTHISPISTLDEVQSELRNYTGRILFDLTLINGTSSNRYIEAQIVDGVFARKSFATVRGLSVEITDQWREFFVNHKDLVKNGTITHALKALLISGERF